MLNDTTEAVDVEEIQQLIEDYRSDVNLVQQQPEKWGYNESEAKVYADGLETVCAGLECLIDVYSESYKYK